jgi:N4-gp56 family major capsid protein
MASNLLLTPEIRQAYNRTLLDRFRTKLVFNQFGDQQGIPKNNGVNLQWRRMEIIRPVATASTTTWISPDATYTDASARLLTEGTFTTPAVIATWTAVSATVRQYGQAAYISEWNDDQAIDPAVPNYVENLGEAAGELSELVTRDVLLAMTNVQYAGSAASASALISGFFLTLAELRKAKRTLKAANAEPVVDGKFVVIAHPDTVYDLESDTNITNIWQYGGGGAKQGQIFDTTFKDLPLGFRLVESTIAPISRASGYGDIYNTWVIGKQLFGTVAIGGMKAKVIVHEPGSSGVSDALDQVATVGYKLNFAAVILNQSNGVLIKHTTSASTGTRAGL